LPFLESGLIDLLLENSDNFQTVIPVHDGIMEPLAGLYHTDLGAYFEASVNAGNLALHRILGAARVRYPNASLLTKKFPLMFDNLN